MALRMTGMYSGIDTESIIQELVAARQKKVDVKKKAQIKLEWKQDAWKELNTKLKNFQSKYLSNMRFTSAYTKKVTKVSNSSAVSVITGENAVNGVQSLLIDKLAKTGYLTGDVVKGAAEGESLTAMSKLSEVAGLESIGDGTISISSGSKTVDIKVNADTTISDFLTQVKNAGLNASFDERWQRFSISSKESGLKNDFSITASDENGDKVLSSLGLKASLYDDAATRTKYEEYAKYFVKGSDNAETKAKTLEELKTLIDTEVASRTEAYLKQYKELTASKKAAQEKIAEINEKYKDNPLVLSEDYEAQLKSKNDAIKEKEKELADITDPNAKRAAEEELVALRKEAADLQERVNDAKTLKTQQDNIGKYNDQLNEIEKYVTISGEGDEATATEKQKLIDEVGANYYNKASYASKVMDEYNRLSDEDKKNLPKSATKINGQDAIIYLNGAKFENTNNTFEINGLTFTALSETKGEEITVTTEQDTDGIYDMVKNFLKDYNELVNEMDKLYNAGSAKGYEPLTDEEKDAMSEKEIEKWEEKVKDALLRRDDNLSTVNSALQSIMASGIEVNGKTMYLFDFGIDTLGYFNAADNEKHAYHIDGDPDDNSTSGNADKLKTMIANDPDTVVAFFTKLSQNLYTKMSDLSKSVDGYRSFGNFYDDKKMKSDYDSYTSKIKEMEVKLTEYEDKWYAKFSKMETALAKMQSNANAVTSLLGG